MQVVTPKSGKVDVSALVSNTSTLLTQTAFDSSSDNPTPDAPTRLDLLRAQFHQLGLGLYEVNGGTELTVTGPGACGSSLSDYRAAAMYLRELRKGAA